ncbi:MAG TPA: SPFH domain-containing protein [Negativicutes bacterium]|nr:SPFH domain-containing protein [Negativicutes bacterium]
MTVAGLPNFAALATIAMIVVGLLVLIIILAKTVVVVGGNEIAVLERKYFGRPMPQGRVVAQENEIGVQARTLGPGLHFLVPFLYNTRKQQFTLIKEDEIGLVESIDGNSIPPGKIFGRTVEGHNTFQDGAAFLANGGEKGPQIPVIPAGTYRINPFLFTVRVVPVTVIPSGQIGIVTSMDGQPIKPGRLLAERIEGHSTFENGQAFLDKGGQRGPQIDILLPGTYRINTDLFKVELKEATVVPANKVGLVTARDGKPLPEKEFVAKHVEGHKDFQDASAFLATGGQRGPQFDVLRPGTYYINPTMFLVGLDDVAVIERGQVAVVVSNVGDEPKQVTQALEESAAAVENVSQAAKESIENRLRHGLERYVVPEGFRGIQQEVIGPGTYYLNRMAFHAYTVDTTNITIDWDESADTKFDPLKVVSKDGFEMGVSVKVIIRVRPDQAPYMVAKIGSIENLVSHVIHPMIDSSFRNQASSTSAMNFMQDRQNEQKKAEEGARLELERYHVECVSVLICQINLPPELMKTQTERIIAQQQMEMYNSQQQAESKRIATEKTRAEADQQKNLVEAEIGVKIAAQNKEKAIRFAEGEAEAIRLKKEGEAKGIAAVGKAEGERILAIGKATAESYELQNRAIGGDGVVSIEIAKQIAAGNVKVTPDFLVQGGENLGGLLSAYLTQNIAGKPKAETTPDQPTP